MINITIDYKAPDIATKLEQTIKNIENIEDVVLALQLKYREEHSVFYLKNIASIYFYNDFLEIKQKSNSSSYLDYKEILEYNILHIDDLIDWEEY